MLTSKYETALGKNEANYQPLSPIAFLERSALVYPNKPAIIDGERVITYAAMWRRCRQVADALRKAGVGKDDTVSVLSPNCVAALSSSEIAMISSASAWVRDRQASSYRR
jgi:fatty-acyl-CoA synthase